ncbi:MAG: hypothetical protein IT375_04665 [Polyangiaceae bacterium]|nr:hypothetical protein [Polyangiaceae bacterium]
MERSAGSNGWSEILAQNSQAERAKAADSADQHKGRAITWGIVGGTGLLAMAAGLYWRHLATRPDRVEVEETKGSTSSTQHGPRLGPGFVALPLGSGELYITPAGATGRF